MPSDLSVPLPGRGSRQEVMALEDDVLVTETGARRLGPNRLPISPDDVEAAMAR